MQHIIKKQIIDLRIAKDLDAFRIQQAVSDHYRQHLVPLIEKEFDGIAGPDETVLIDRLEIDLGELTEKEVSNIAIGDYIRDKIIRQVTENLKSSNASAENISIRKSVALNSSRQWLYYMQKGYLPWSLLQITEDWHAQVLEALATDYISIEELKKAMLADKHVALRIVQQHTTPFLIKLTEILTAQNQSALHEALAEIQVVLKMLSVNNEASHPLKEVSEKQLWQELIMITASRSDVRSTLQISEALLKKNITIDEHVTGKSMAAIKQQVKILLPVIMQMEKEINAQKGQSKKINLKPEENNSKEAAFPIKEADLMKEYKTAINSAIDEEGIFIQNAGLVLTHPFIATLFNRLGLMSEKKFINMQAREKAVFLLHYIVTGNAAAEEHHLLLPKVLCGYPLEEPVVQEMEFSGQEKEEADDLLKAIIQQWSILNRTSPEGLRETFLKRAGKIFTKNDSIRIQVESGPVDMLLDHLPWSLSMIKLPWIKDVINVEWR